MRLAMRLQMATPAVRVTQLIVRCVVSLLVLFRGTANKEASEHALKALMARQSKMESITFIHTNIAF